MTEYLRDAGWWPCCEYHEGRTDCVWRDPVSREWRAPWVATFVQKRRLRVPIHRDEEVPSGWGRLVAGVRDRRRYR